MGMNAACGAPRADIRRAPLGLAAIMAAVLVSGCSGAGSLSSLRPDCIARSEHCLAAALNEGDVRLFRELLGAGAPATAVDADGDTLMHLAAASASPEFLRVLLQSGLDPNIPNTITSRTPLMTAIVYERDVQMELLLENGADLDRADRTGNTALHVAAQINDPAKVMRLLKAGAPVVARNAQGQTFQRYLFMTPAHLLDRKTRAYRETVQGWLADRGLLERTL